MQPSEVFTICPGENGTWEVTQRYVFRKFLFLNMQEAERFAREQARTVHPSEVVRVDTSGRTVWREIYTSAGRIDS